MKRIGFITKNKVLAQSLATLIKSNQDLPFEPYVFHNFEQAAIDAQIFEIDVAVVGTVAEDSEASGAVMSLCSDLRQTSPDCQILLLVEQESRHSRDEAMKAVSTKTVDDYVFQDTSLDYLLAKLLAL